MTSKIAKVTGENALAARVQGKSKAEIFEDVLRDWLGDKTESTQKIYQEDLSDFTRWAGYERNGDALRDFLALDQHEAHQLLLQYKADLQSRDVEWKGETKEGCSPRTINRRLTVLRSFAQAAFAAGLAAAPIPVRGVRSGDAVRKAIEPEDWEKLVAFLKSKMKKPGTKTESVAKRDLALCRLLRDVGLRRKEALGLYASDVDFKKKELTIHPKGKRGAVMTHPIDGEAWECLVEWLEFVAPDGPLFGFTRLESLNTHLKRLAKRAGIPHLAPHELRRAGITGAVDLFGGYDLRSQAFARHKDPKTTAMYDVKDRKTGIRDVIKYLGES